MAELVDALASGASVRKYVKVQVLSSAPRIEIFHHKKITRSQGDFYYLKLRVYMTGNRKRTITCHADVARVPSGPQAQCIHGVDRPEQIRICQPFSRYSLHSRFF